MLDATQNSVAIVINSNPIHHAYDGDAHEINDDLTPHCKNASQKKVQYSKQVNKKSQEIFSNRRKKINEEMKRNTHTNGIEIRFPNGAHTLIGNPQLTKNGNATRESNN